MKPTYEDYKIKYTRISMMKYTRILTILYLLLSLSIL
jgi:hypothetical protein